MPRPFLIAVALLLAASPPWSLRAADSADPAADIQAQYEAAMHVLAKPPVNGVLVTEVGPDSPAAAAGLRAGDIITEFYGTKIATIQVLRERVAEAVAQRIDESAAGPRIGMRVVRGSEDKNLLVVRSPLDIRAVTVEANVPGPRNPPPNLRGTLALDWLGVAAALAKENEGGAAFRTFERRELDATAAQEWIGWQLCTVTATADSIAGKVVWHRISDISTDADGNATVKSEETGITFHLSLGDYKTTPAFVLDEVEAYYPANFGATSTAAGKRLGERLQATLGAKGGDGPPAATTHDNAASLNTIPQPAVPWIAAALPHEKGAALGLALLSLRDLQSRPGYVIVAHGPDPMPPDADGPKVKQVSRWRVDLVHLGVIIESYWFSDDRQLLCIQSQGVQSNVSYRAASLRAASLPAVPRTQPATRAAPAPSGATRP